MNIEQAKVFSTICWIRYRHFFPLPHISHFYVLPVRQTDKNALALNIQSVLSFK